MTLRLDFDAHKRDVGDVRRRGRVVHRSLLAARRERFGIVLMMGMPEGKVAYCVQCDLCSKPACNRIKRSAPRGSDLCDVVSRLCQSGCGPFAKALSKALQSGLRSLCKGAFKGFAKRLPLALPFFKATDPLQGQSENGRLARDKVSKLRIASDIRSCDIVVWSM